MSNQLNKELLARATPEELALIEDTATLLKALESPLQLGLYCGMLEAFPHVVKLDEFFMAMVEWRLYKDGPGPVSVLRPDGFRYHPITGERALRKMMVSEPVRHGKSLYGSTLVPAWHKLKWADRPLMSVSSGDDFASKWSKSVRDLIEEHPEFGQLIDPGNKAALSWRTKGHSAEYNAAGVAGQISGKSAFAIIMDDLVKNMAVATSPAEMATLLSLYDSAIRKRLTKDFDANYESGWELYIGTPYSKLDLRSQLLRREPELWFEFNLAAVSGTEVDEDGIWLDPATGRPDIMGRGKEEALCPQIRTYAEHAEDRKLDPKTFAAMSQGTPKVDGGNLVTVFPEYARVTTQKGFVYQLKQRDGTLKEVHEDDLIKFNTIDLAMTKKTYSDFTVFTSFGVTPERELLVLDVIRTRINQPEHKEWVSARYAEHGGFITTAQTDQLSESLSQAMYMNTDVPFEIQPKSKGDKVARFLLHVAPLFSTYRIYFDTEAEYFTVLQEEVSDFPDVDHDDIVDTLTLGGQRLPMIPLRTPKTGGRESEITQLWNRIKGRNETPGVGQAGGFSMGGNVWRSLR